MQIHYSITLFILICITFPNSLRADDISLKGCSGEHLNSKALGANTSFYQDHGYYYDYPQTMKDLGVETLRFPGGSESDNYDWQTNYLIDDRIGEFYQWAFYELIRQELNVGTRAINNMSNQEIVDSEAGPVIASFDWNYHLDASRMMNATEFNFVVNVDGATREILRRPGANEQAIIDKWADFAAGFVTAVKNRRGPKVTYWEIGNESELNDDISADLYGTMVKTFAQKMKAANPKIKVGATGPKDYNKVDGADHYNKTGIKWWPRVLNKAGDLIDFIVIHHYDQYFTERLKVDGEPVRCEKKNGQPAYMMCPGSRKSCDHKGYCIKFAFNGEVKMRPTGASSHIPLKQALSQFKKDMTNKLGRTPEIFVTEWNVFNKTFSSYSRLEHLIYSTEVLGHLLEGGMTRTQYWPMSGGVNWGNPLFVMGLSSDPERPFRKLPAYRMFQLWQDHIHGRIIQFDGLNKSESYVLGTCKSNGLNEVSFIITNKTNSTKTLEFSNHVPYGFKLTQLKAWDGNHHNYNTEKTRDEVHDIYEKQLPIQDWFKKLKVELPPKAVYFLTNKDANFKTLKGDSHGSWRDSQRRFSLNVNGDRDWNGSVDYVVDNFAQEGDIPLVGDWNGDGYDEVGFYRPTTREFVLDVNGDGVFNSRYDKKFVFGNSGDIPIKGDWNRDGKDEIGVFRPINNSFTLDKNGNGRWDTRSGGDMWFNQFGNPGDLPIVGDWDGNGRDEIGVFRPRDNSFTLDMNNNGQWDPGTDRWYLYGGKTGSLPLIGDWNGDGDDDLGIYEPERKLFVLDYNNNGKIDGGHRDYVAQAHWQGDTPIAGHWRPKK